MTSDIRALSRSSCRVRTGLAQAALAGLAAMALASCGGGASTSQRAPTPPLRTVPVSARPFARRLTEAEAELRQKIGTWRRAAPEPRPPRKLTAWARYEQR